MSLFELKQMANLEARQAKVNKKLQNIVQEGTPKPLDEEYLIEEKEPDLLALPSEGELISDDDIRQIEQYVDETLMPQQSEDLLQKAKMDPENFDKYYFSIRDKKVKDLIRILKNKRMAEAKRSNIGQGPVERLPNESDSAYADRLESINLSLPDPDEIINLRKVKVKNELLDKLQRLMRRSDAEALLNEAYFTDENILLLNRIWPKFEVDVKKTFKSIDIATLLDYIKQYLKTFKSEKLTRKTRPGPSLDDFSAEPPDLSPEFFTPLKKEDVVAETPKTFPKIEFPPESVHSDKDKRDYVYLKLKDEFKTKEEAIQAVNDSGFDVNTNQARHLILKALAKKIVDSQKTGHGIRYIPARERLRRRVILGKGIAKTEEHERYFQFGKFLLDGDKLRNNILRLIYESTGGRNQSMPLVRVSDDFKDLLMHIVDTKSFNERAFKRLSKEEREYMRKMLQRSEVQRILHIPDLEDEEEKDLKNRWEIITGEIEIGNDSPLLRKEAKEIIRHFVEKRTISKAQGYKLLSQLSE